MNAFQYPWVRIAVSIAAGLLLIVYPHAALPTILLIIGALLAIPSLYALLAYLLVKDRHKRPIPLWELAMLIFGCTLILRPDWYISIAIYVLGGSLVLTGVYELLYLLTLKKSLRNRAGWVSYLLPVVILLIGLEILANPFSATERVMVVTFGAAAILYGVADLLYYFKFK